MDQNLRSNSWWFNFDPYPNKWNDPPSPPPSLERGSACGLLQSFQLAAVCQAIGVVVFLGGVCYGQVKGKHFVGLSHCYTSLRFAWLRRDVEFFFFFFFTGTARSWQDHPLSPRLKPSTCDIPSLPLDPDVEAMGWGLGSSLRCGACKACREHRLISYSFFGS